jgi:ankyrin repeat protein
LIGIAVVTETKQIVAADVLLQEKVKMKRFCLSLLLLSIASSFAFAHGQNVDTQRAELLKDIAEANRRMREKRDDMLFYDAIRNGNLTMVKRLIKNGVSVNTNGDLLWGNYSPLMSAAARGNEAIFDYLLAKGAQTDAVDTEGHTVLHWAVTTGLVGGVKKLLARKPNLSKRDQSGNTALASACEWRKYRIGSQSDKIHGDIASLLLNTGADVNSVNEQGCTPMMLAARCGSLACVQSLLNHGANVNRIDAQNNTALLLAADYGYTDIVEMLVTHAANVNATNLHGDTSLMLAAENGDARSVSLLIKHGANIQKKDVNGYTALERAVRVNVGALLGADVPVNAEVADNKANEIDFALYALILADLRRERVFSPWSAWSQSQVNGGAGPMLVAESSALKSLTWDSRYYGHRVTLSSPA